VHQQSSEGDLRGTRGLNPEWSPEIYAS